MYLSDSEVMLAAVKKNGTLLDLAPADLKSDYLIVAAAVSQNGEAILCSKLSVTRSLLEIAVSTTGHVLKYFEEYCKDVELVRLGVCSYPWALGFLPENWQDNQELVYLAAKRSAISFKLASDRLKDDEEAVLKVVKVQPMALRYVSTRLRDNEQVVSTALCRDGSSLQYASERLRSDPLIVEQSMRGFTGEVPLAFSLVSPTKKMILLGVKQTTMTLNYATKLLEDNEFVAALIRENPEVICLLPSSIRANRELAILAVSLDSSLYIHPKLRMFMTDPEVAALAVCDNFELIERVPRPYLLNERLYELLLDAKRRDPARFYSRARRFLDMYRAKRVILVPWGGFYEQIKTLMRSEELFSQYYGQAADVPVALEASAA